jgi:hypothetical protein
MEQGMTEESDKLDFLDGTEEAPEAQVEAPAEVAEPTGEQEAAPPVAAEEKPQTIPITALLDEREKRQDAIRKAEGSERRAEEAERRLKELERRIAAAQQQRKPPDFFEKPEEAVKAQVDPILHRMFSDKLDFSEALAEEKYGAETVETAKQAFIQAMQEDPDLYRKVVVTSKHPYDAVVKWHKKHSALSKIGDDPEAYIAAEIERRLQEAQQSQSSPAPVNRPPISLAAAPAAGRGNPQAKGNAFDQAFPV